MGRNPLFQLQKEKSSHMTDGTAKQKNHETVQKVAEFSSQYFKFGLLGLEYDLDQAEQHCTLSVQIGSCLYYRPRYGLSDMLISADDFCSH